MAKRVFGVELYLMTALINGWSSNTAVKYPKIIQVQVRLFIRAARETRSAAPNRGG